MNSETLKDIVVAYHADCFDGFTAAWAGWKKFGDAASYIPVHHHLDFPDITNRELYIVDFCPSQSDVLERLLKNNKKLVVIDHHISEKDSIAKVPEHVFDDNHSGAVLAWKYFHPDTPVPTISQYVEDYDMWSWKMPHTREVINMIGLNNLSTVSFSEWDVISDALSDENKLAEYVKQGAAIQKYKNVAIEHVIKYQTQLVEFEGYEVLATNCPRVLRSEVGSELAKRKPPFGIVWSQTGGKIVFSLRGVGDIDLESIARKFSGEGGGGHKLSAGFSIPFGSPFPWKVIQNNEK